MPDAALPSSLAPAERPVRWGLGDVALGLGVGLSASTIGGGVVLALSDVRHVDDLSLGYLAVFQVFLWTGLLGAPLVASARKGNGPVTDFGLRQRWSDIPLGVACGLATQLIVIPVIYLPILWLFGEQDVSEVARDLTERTEGQGAVVVALLVVVVAIGAPVVEELFFRGLLLRSLERRWGTKVALVASSLVFGAFHFQVLQFPALVAFGLVAGWLTIRTGRLGPAIWAHVAFNGISLLILLADLS